MSKTDICLYTQNTDIHSSHTFNQNSIINYGTECLLSRLIN